MPDDLNVSPVVNDHGEDFRRALSEQPAAKSSFLHRFLFAHPSFPVVFVIALLLLTAVFMLDRMTGPYAISYFYAMPVLVMAWYYGKKAGFFMLAITISVWVTADYLGFSGQLPHIYLIMNAITRLFLLSVAIFMLCTFKDLSTQLGAMVDERTKALRQLAAQLSDAEDFQRRHLANDIHDGFSQTLSVLKISLGTSLSESQHETPQSNRIKDAIGIVSDLIEKARTLTFDLHPAMLEHLGLTPTLRRHGEQFTRQTNIDVTLNEEGDLQPLSPAITNYLFRAIKDLLNNSAKHGHAKQIIVSLYWTPILLRIVVDDDGSGFEPGVVLAPSAAKGLGLASLQERLGSLGGSVRI